MPVYNLIDQLVLDLTDAPDAEYLLVQHGVILYQSTNGTIPLSEYSQLGKSILRVCSNLRFDTPYYSSGFLHLLNPNSFLTDRPVSIVDVTIQIFLTNNNTQLQLSVLDLRESIKLYRKCKSTLPTLKHLKLPTTSFL